MTGSDHRLTPDIEQELTASLERRAQVLARREQIGDGAFAGMFVVAAATLALLADSAAVDMRVAGAYVIAYAIASLVRFPTGTGYLTPTQVVFVPMLFALPPAVVPLLVASGAVLAQTIKIARGEVGSDRWIVGIGNSWFAFFPALVFVLAGAGEPAWQDLPIYALAFVAQFAGDTVISVIRAWACLLASPKLVAREVAWVYRADSLLTPVGVLGAYAASDEPLAGLLAMPVIFLLRSFAEEREGRITRELELQRAYRGTALLLGDVIEDDDAYTGEHTRGVVELSLAVADEMRVDAETRRATEFGALLHDVGKVRMPKQIINKPGPLVGEEWAIMRTHTIEGQRMLERVGGPLATIGLVVRGSHERWDGGGYPDGLAGSEIPLASRIVAACDAYNAMTTDRSYRRALPPSLARAELTGCAGSQFDEAVIAALLRVLDRATPMSQVADDAVPV